MIALALALVVSASPAQPEPLASFATPLGRALTEHMRKGMLDPQVGQWVTYRLDGGGDRVSFWRIAIVGEETDIKGRPAFWVEMDHGEHHLFKSPLAQLRMLVTKDLGFTRDGITRAYMAFGVNKPIELEPSALEVVMGDEPDSPPAPKTPAAAAKASPISAEHVKMHQGKEQSLVTLAGTVSAMPVEMRYRATVVKRIWMSRQVPIFHLARVEVPAIEHAMEVREFGVDARPMMVLPAKDAPKVKAVPYTESELRKENEKNER